MAHAEHPHFQPKDACVLDLDLRLVVGAMSIVCLLQTLTIAFFSRIVAKHYPGVRWWIWATLSNMFGMQLLFLRGLIPDFVSIVVANAGLALALVFGLIGTHRFFGQPNARKEQIVWASFGFFMLSVVYFTYLQPSIQWRTAILSLLLSGLGLLNCHSLWQINRPELRSSTQFTALVFAVSGGGLLLRGVGTLLLPPTNDLFAPTAPQIATFISSFAVLLLWLAGILAIITQQLMVDRQEAEQQRFAAVEARHQAEKQLATEAERRRIARELHESVCQALFGAHRTSAALPMLWELDPDEGREALVALQGFTNSALSEMRTLLVELQPHRLNETPFDQILAELILSISQKHDLRVESHLETVPLLPLEVQTALYRIAQEALSNVSKHANAHHLALTLLSEQDSAHFYGLRLVISDDGRGFNPHQVSEQSGLGTMQQYAHEIGALVEVSSALGQGTHMRLHWQARPALALRLGPPLARPPRSPERSAAR